MFFDLFKPKKSARKEGTTVTLEEILKGIDELPEEEKTKVKSKMDDLYKAEDEREIDKIEESKTDNPETADDKAEEVKEESKEIGKDVDEVKDEVETGEDKEHHDDTKERLGRIEELLAKLLGEEKKERESQKATEDERKKLSEIEAIYN